MTLYHLIVFETTLEEDITIYCLTIFETTLDEDIIRYFWH